MARGCGSFCGGLAAAVLFSVLWIGIVEAGSDVSLSNAIRDNNGKSFHIECNYTQFVNQVQANNPNANIKYHVRIMAEKTPLVDKDLSATDVSVGKASLSYDAGIDKNMNKDYRCEVSATVAGSKKVLVSTSEKKFLGIRATTNQLTITEGDVANLTIVSTVPILCERSFGQCCLDLDLQIGSARNQLSTFTNCVYQICKDDWNDNLSAAIKNISVIANPDGITDGNTDLRIKFRPLVPSGGGRVKQVFDDVKIPSVPVKVIDHPPGKCLVGGDPHLRRFTNQILNFQEVGDYTFYQNNQQNFDVHVRTWPCGNFRTSRASCISGVLVRDGKDVLRISLADGITLPPSVRRMDAWARLSYRHGHSKLTLTTDQHNLQDGTTVDIDRQGFITVKTPSGAVVTAQRQGRSINTILSIPPSFRKDPHQNGLCGSYANNSQALIDPHGRHHQCTPWRARLPICRNARFSESWKLDRNKTLFFNPPTTKHPRESQNTIYCGCANALNQTSTPLINCSNDGNKPPGRKGCPLCTAAGVQQGLYGGTFGKRSVLTTSQNDQGFDPFDFNQEVPGYKGLDHFPDNITQKELDRIETMCRQAVSAAPMATHCANMTSLADDYVNQCVDDTVLSGVDDFVASAVSAYNSECLYEIQMDPNNYVTKPDGTLVIKDDIQNLCPMGCDKNETCVKGVCECAKGAVCNTASANTTPSPSATTTAHTHTHTHSSHGTTTKPSSSSSATTKTTSATATPQFALMDKVVSYTQHGTTQNGDACDVSKGVCQKIQIHTSGVTPANHLPHNFVCLWQEWENNKVVYTHRQAGHYKSPSTIECAIPHNIYLGSDSGKPYRTFQIHTLHSTHFMYQKSSVNMTFFDSDCVTFANGSFVPSGKSCIINNYCHSDGAKNVLVDGEKCVASISTGSWSQANEGPINANTRKLTLDGPDDDLKVTCGIGAGTTERIIDWYTNDRKVASQRVPPGQTSASKDLMSIWGSGPPVSIQCRLEAGILDKTVYVSDPITIL